MMFNEHIGLLLSAKLDRVVARALAICALIGPAVAFLARFEPHFFHSTDLVRLILVVVAIGSMIMTLNALFCSVTIQDVREAKYAGKQHRSSDRKDEQASRTVLVASSGLTMLELGVPCVIGIWVNMPTHWAAGIAMAICTFCMILLEFVGRTEIKRLKADRQIAASNTIQSPDEAQ